MVSQNTLNAAYTYGSQLALTKIASGVTQEEKDSLDVRNLMLGLFISRGVGSGASSLGYERAMKMYGKRLANAGYDPENLPGKLGGSWIGYPTRYSLMGGALGAGLGAALGHSRNPLLLGGMALGSGLGAWKTHGLASETARDLLNKKVTEDTELIKTKKYVKRKLKKLEHDVVHGEDTLA